MEVPISPRPGPDFSSVDTEEKARQLYERGDLVKLFLLPPIFGGEDVLPNIVYVPIWVGQFKESHDRNVVAPLAAQGKVTHYAAVPKYAGASHIPIAIEITASDPAQVTYVIHIWGDALQDEANA
jgi:hypothetical protein